MASKCPVCEGRGLWQQRDMFSVFDNTIVWHYCNTCHGTGVNQDPEEIDDFDIGGSLDAEED